MAHQCRRYKDAVMFLIRIRKRFFTECILITGATWLIFLGEQMWDELNVLLGRGGPLPPEPVPSPEGAI